MTEFKVDMDILYANNIGFEAYFILYCLYTNEKQLLVSYVIKCKKINTDIFKELESKGFINIKADAHEIISYELLSLTDKGRNIVIYSHNDPSDQLPKKSESNFEEFRTFYPMRVKEGFKTRTLQGNLKGCRKTYDKLLMETTHDLLCKCAKLYIDEKFRAGDQWYIQNLETWLNQRNYLQYIEDAKQLELTTNNTIKDQSEDI